jgi:UDP-N-acetylglucosamine 2-epimerase (non-hydrolysing)
LAHLHTSSAQHLYIIEPLGYLDFLALEQHARFVITDSGGIQEETTCLQVPCITLRENTERPVTVSIGTNVLVGHDMDLLKQHVHDILGSRAKKGTLPALWDGDTASRIAEVVTSGVWRRCGASNRVLQMAR